MSMASDDILSFFRKSIDQDVAIPVAAMNTLTYVVKLSKSNTWMGLEQELREAITLLKGCRHEDLGGRTSISLGSGCDLFMRYVSRAFNIESKDFSSCKAEILRRGERFSTISLRSRTYIATIGQEIISDGSTILVHGSSRVVFTLLYKAISSGKNFDVLLTEGRPLDDNQEAIKKLHSYGITPTIIPDTSIGSVMDRVTLCLVGAEGVMENGGIINQMGTYQIAMVAKMCKKPFYVCVESYKFSRMYPLTQRDIIDLCHHPSTSMSYPSSSISNTKESETMIVSKNTQLIQKLVNTTIDFTPAEYITLLFTDLGILTPAAVSEELIRLYQ